MSAKCCSTAFTIDISRISTPRASIRAMALPWGAPRCAESGHSDAQNTFSVKAEAVESPHRHEKSQGRIQSARYAYHKATGARGIEPLA